MAAYEDPAGLIAGSVVMQGFSTAAVGLRLWSRRGKGQPNWTTSEWLIICAWIFGSGLSVMEIYGIATKILAAPLKSTIYDADASNLRVVKATQIELAYLILGVVAMGLIKLSVCLLYWNIFGRAQMLRKFLVIWICMNIAWTIGFVGFLLGQCGSHLLALFSATEHLTYCEHHPLAGYFLMATDIAMDFIMLAIPVPVILRLKMSKSTKILTILTFMAGALCLSGSIAKAYIYMKSRQDRFLMDGITLLTALSIWNLAEVQIGIVAACGPTLRQPLARLMPRTKSITCGLRKLGLRRKSQDSDCDRLPSFVQTPEQGSARYLQEVRQVALIVTPKNVREHTHLEGNGIPPKTTCIGGNPYRS